MYLLLTDPCCHGNEIWDKIGYNGLYTSYFRDLCVLVSSRSIVMFKLLHLAKICILTSAF